MTLNARASFGRQLHVGLRNFALERLFDSDEAALLQLGQVCREVSGAQSREGLQEREVGRVTDLKCRQDRQPGRLMEEPVQIREFFKRGHRHGSVVVQSGTPS